MNKIFKFLKETLFIFIAANFVCAFTLPASRYLVYLYGWNFHLIYYSSSIILLLLTQALALILATKVQYVWANRYFYLFCAVAFPVGLFCYSISRLRGEKWDENA